MNNFSLTRRCIAITIILIVQLIFAGTVLFKINDSLFHFRSKINNNVYIKESKDKKIEKKKVPELKTPIMVSLSETLIPNVLCDNLHFEGNKQQEALYRSCIFKKYSVCYRSKSDEWLFNPKILPYNNYGLISNQKYNQQIIFEYPTINLRFASNSKRSIEGRKWWKLRQIKHYYPKIEDNNTYYIDNITILGVHTEHSENLGHAFAESYLSILTAVNNWVTNGIFKDEPNITVILQNNVVSRYDNTIGAALFERMMTLSELQNISRDNGFEYICFNQLIVGTSQLEMLNGGIHMNQEILKYMRYKILKYYNINPYWVPNSVNDINMLIIVKNSSFWPMPHKNWVTNYESDVKRWINNKYIQVINKKINKLTIIDPMKTAMEDQVKLISNASLILTQWGGGSMENFLQPLNGVQIIVTTWDPPQHYIQAKSKDIIPDFDYYYRKANGLQTILRYNDLKGNDRIERIEMDLLYRIMDASLNILLHNYNIY